MVERARHLDTNTHHLQAVFASKTASGAPEANDCELLMVLDGASTTGVVQDPAYCVDIKTVDKYIKTGGQGKPNLVRCTQEGSLPVDMLVDKRRVQMLIPGFKIVPGFGVNILPECIFLKKGFEVKKKGALCQVLTPNGKLILTADWLFFVRVGLARKKTDAVLTTTQQQHLLSLPQQLPQLPQLEDLKESDIVRPTFPYNGNLEVISTITYVIVEEE